MQKIIKITLLMSVILSSSPFLKLDAGEIRRKGYQFQYNSLVKGEKGDTFLICADKNCPVPDKLKKTPSNKPHLAARVSDDLEALPTMTVTSAAAPVMVENNTIPACNTPGCQSPVEEIKTPIVESRKECKKETIYFDFNKSDLNSINQEKALKTAEDLKEDQELLIAGYTCDIGSNAYNDILAWHRADVVAAALIKAGISISPDQVKGFGKSRKFEDRKLNRRVEITIKQKGEDCA